MNVTNKKLYNYSRAIITQLYGEKAEFREGQYEAIEATLLNKRTLVVQRTGWGKSLVYFLCTKLFRDNGRGVAVVVSPLLVLMENQIEPRKRWATTALTKQSRILHQNEIGICLAKYGDPGYGTLVKDDKYSSRGRFCDELVGKSASLLKDFVSANEIDAITCVPSLRSNIVQDFSERLTKRLGIRFAVILCKSNARQQKTMQNSSYQCENALRSFSVINSVHMPENVLLVDDVVDSRWTITVCGSKLIEAGCLKVFPFALADSSQKEE